MRLRKDNVFKVSQTKSVPARIEPQVCVIPKPDFFFFFPMMNNVELKPAPFLPWVVVKPSLSMGFEHYLLAVLYPSLTRYMNQWVVASSWRASRWMRSFSCTKDDQAVEEENSSPFQRRLPLYEKWNPILLFCKGTIRKAIHCTLITSFILR